MLLRAITLSLASIPLPKYYPSKVLLLGSRSKPQMALAISSPSRTQNRPSSTQVTIPPLMSTAGDSSAIPPRSLNAHLKLSREIEQDIRNATGGLIPLSLIRFRDDGPFPHLTFTTTFFTESVFNAVASQENEPISLCLSGVRIVRNRWVFLDVAKDAAAAQAFQAYSEVLSKHVHPGWGDLTSYENWEPHITLGVLPAEATPEQISAASVALESWWRVCTMSTVEGRLCLGDVGEFGTVIKRY